MTKWQNAGEAILKDSPCSILMDLFHTVRRSRSR